LYSSGQGADDEVYGFTGGCSPSCLDNGVNMMGCSQLYYKTMDSILNVAYNKLRKTLTIDRQTALKQEQLKWIKKRDAHHAAELKNIGKMWMPESQELICL
jgi:uncharacterized protein YecT (DUF1311 family)